MIHYKESKLANGLTVLAHCDKATRMVAVNMLYRVGAKNENPDRTGFAHLFEHLMFRGTKQVPNFDIPVQQACGENNAFTNNDYTDYYITLPKDNIETALWLESDRMTGLDITAEELETEKKVVIEEYNQRYRNQPYGDTWIRLRAMAYKVHPYRWATIGLSREHIEGATLEEVRDFYHKYYNPGNAIISIAGDIPEDEAIGLCEKWFGNIPHVDLPPHATAKEPQQKEQRRQTVTADVPAVALTIAFKMGDRLSRNHYVCNLISDLLAGGTSGRLYQSLVKKKKLFSAINAYITNDVDPGLFVITGHLQENIGPDNAEKAIWEELEILKDKPVSDYELEKVKNKFEAEITYGEINAMNKAINLGYYNFLGDMTLLNRETDIYSSITAEDVIRCSHEVFDPLVSSVLVYLPKNAKS